ncbi:methyltransferase [Lacimicrobium sp. SS2-24]|uniref:tRNA1(Val) (adenine(37)-N6)-methyltransferase n=1 Tax=Lacimicrobium sp. SS2-24 TaxID=2005569 RepID=UPI001130AA13|nr:methyltransferase [Lacimicrobium sp. SS2-24]
MSNSAKRQRTEGFQFKQFFVAHDRCAMKVGTDSIMLGSWAEPGAAVRILDVGTGSGLLALMMAQQSGCDSRIFGIDVDAQAIAQAKDNAKNSPWADKLHFDCLALQDHANSGQYDLIISNPPYYPHHHEIAQSRQSARLTATLSHAALIQVVSGLLGKEGRFCCVLPQQVVEQVLWEAGNAGLHLTRRMDVRSQPDKSVSRVMLEWSLSRPSQFRQESLVIQQQAGHYTQAFQKLCRGFYVNF